MRILQINSDTYSIESNRVAFIIRVAGVAGVLDRVLSAFEQLGYPKNVSEKDVNAMIKGFNPNANGQPFTAKELAREIDSLHDDRIVNDQDFFYLTDMFDKMYKKGEYKTNLSDTGPNAGSPVDTEPMTDADDQYNESKEFKRKKTKPNMRYSTQRNP